MTQDEIIHFATSLTDVVAQTADEASGAPELAWGDTFFFFGAETLHPFATIVVKDYPDFDTASHLDRPGVFRLNVSVGRDGFQELLGYPPNAHAEHAHEFDYTALDTLIPHPAYAKQGWVSILNPGEQARALLTRGYERATV
jgi:hypothetical protein